MEGENEPPAGQRKDSHGVFFQARCLELIALRAFERGTEFSLTSEVEEAQKLDDGVLFQTDEMGNKYVSVFQMKHQPNPKIIKASDLLSNNQMGDLNLAKYFESFIDIKLLTKSAHSKFQVPVKEIFIITNRPIVANLKPMFTEIGKEDPMSPRYCPTWPAFQLKKDYFTKRIFALSKATCDRERLLVDLAGILLESKTYDNNSVVRKYVIPISRDVLEGTESGLKFKGSLDFVESLRKELEFQSRKEDYLRDFKALFDGNPSPPSQEDKEFETRGMEEATRLAQTMADLLRVMKKTEEIVQCFLAHIGSTNDPLHQDHLKTLTDSFRELLKSMEETKKLERILGDGQKREAFIKCERLDPFLVILRRHFIDIHVQPFNEHQLNECLKGDRLKKFVRCIKCLQNAKIEKRQQLLLEFLKKEGKAILEGQTLFQMKSLSKMMNSPAIATKYGKIRIASSLLMSELSEIYASLEEEFRSQFQSPEECKKTLSKICFESSSNGKIMEDDDLLREIPEYPKEEEVEEFLDKLYLYAGFPSANDLQQILETKLKKDLGTVYASHFQDKLEIQMKKFMDSPKVQYYNKDNFGELLSSLQDESSLETYLKNNSCIMEEICQFQQEPRIKEFLMGDVPILNVISDHTDLALQRVYQSLKILQGDELIQDFTLTGNFLICKEWREAASNHNLLIFHPPFKDWNKIGGFLSKSYIDSPKLRRKAIVITTPDGRRSLCKCLSEDLHKPLEISTELQDLKEKCRKEILTKKIKLQNVTMSLENLFNGSAVPVVVWKEALRGRIAIDKELDSEDSFYIPLGTTCPAIVSPEALLEVNEPNFYIEQLDDSFEEIIKNNNLQYKLGKNILLDKNEMDQNSIRLTAKEGKLYINLPIQTKVLKKYIQSPRTYSEEQLLDEITKGDKIVTIVSGNPGAGKTTLLRKLKASLEERECFACYLSCKKLSSQDRGTKIVDSVENLTKAGEIVTRFIFDSKENILFLLDGVDEVNYNARDDLLDRVEELLKDRPNSQIIITTRRHEERRVISKFKVLPYTMQELSENAQRQILEQCLGPDRIDEANKILDKIHPSFCSNPLHLNMVVKTSINDRVQINSKYSLYTQFINQKIRLFLDRNNDTNYLPGDIEKAITRIATELFYPSLRGTFQSEYEVCQDNEVPLLGIGHRVDGQVVFAHYSYGEYFCAKYFLNRLRDQTPNRDVIIKFINDTLYQDLEGILQFIDSEMSSDTWKNGEQLLTIFEEALLPNLSLLAWPWNSFWGLTKFVLQLDLLRNPASNKIVSREVIADLQELWTKNGLYEAVEYLEERNYPATSQNSELIIMSSEKGFKEITEFYIKKGYDINYRQKGGRKATALEAAVNNDHLEIVDLLLNHKIDMNAQDEQGRTPLHWAAIKGNEGLTNRLIGANAFIEAKDNNGRTALLTACVYGKEDVVRLLLRKNANRTLVDQNGWTILHCCAWGGLAGVIEELLESRMDIEAKDNLGTTPLLLACQQGKEDVARLFLSKGADTTVIQTDGCTLLHSCVWGGLTGMIRELLESGMDFEAKTDMDSTPLLLACQQGKEDVVRLFLSKSANRTVIQTDGCTILHCCVWGGLIDIIEELLVDGMDIEAKDSLGTTPLLLACQQGEEDVARFFLSKGADKAVIREDGWTILHCCAWGGLLRMVEELLATGMDIEAKDALGTTPLLLACQQGKEDVARFFLSKGADEKVIRKDGWTILHCCACGGLTGMIRELVEAGMCIDVKDYEGTTPLLLACQQGKEDVARLFLSKGASTAVIRNDGWTILHFCAWGGLEKMIGELLATGIDIDPEDDNGTTPLLLACYQGNEDVVGLFLRNGANRSVIRSDGCTIRHFCVRGGLTGILRELLESEMRIDGSQWKHDLDYPD